MNDNDRPRLDAEWIAVNALRELIHLATEGDSSKATYDQALALGAKIIPSLLGQDSLLKKARESEVAREYRQLAQAESLRDGKEVSALSLLMKDLAKYEQALNAGRNQHRTDQIKRRLTAMKRARDELDPTKHNETELIFRDAHNVGHWLPELNSGQGFNDFRLSEREFLRVRVLHPDRPEHISGADIFYERHEPYSQTASVVAVQYKIWEDKTLRLSDTRMQEQLGRLKAFLCDQNICNAGPLDHDFRFPFCSAFLRPTDKLQSATQRLASTGEHIPICRIEELTSQGTRGGDLLRHEDVCHLSLSHDVFQQLFTTGKLGSRILGYAELEEIYQRLQVPGHDRILIHAQDFSDTEMGYFGEDDDGF